MIRDPAKTMRAALAAAAVLAAAVLAAAAQGAAAQGAAAETAEAFYRGKTVRVIHPGSAGGSYAVYTRTVAEHLGRHIPGEPGLVAEFMPGAGGLTGLNYVYNAAPKDGTVLVMPLPSVAIAHLLFPKSAKFDPAKFTWIGNVTQMQTMIGVFGSSPAKTIEDAKTAEVILGSSGKGSELSLTPQLLNDVIGTKFKIITGYNGVGAINVAMERGELHGRSGGWTSWKPMKPDWFGGEPKVTFLAQLGMFKHPALPDVPLVTEFAGDEQERKVLALMSRATALTRAVAAPPGVPEDRITALRAAFDAMMKDPAFLADMEKRRMVIIGPMNWREIERFMAELTATPPEVIERFQTALGVN